MDLGAYEMIRSADRYSSSLALVSRQNLANALIRVPLVHLDDQPLPALHVCRPPRRVINDAQGVRLFSGKPHVTIAWLLLQPDSVTRCEHSAPTTIARPIRAGLGDVHDTLSCCVAECAQKVVAVRGDDDHFPRRS